MCLDQFFSFVSISGNVVLEIINSNFFIAFLTAGAGAFAGAFGAQKIIEKSKYKQDLLNEIRNTHAATVMTFQICNSFISFKDSVARPLYNSYYKKKKEFEKFEVAKSKGEDKKFNIEFDLDVLMQLELPISKLEPILYEKISVLDRAISLLHVLEQSQKSLNNVILVRNNFIEDFKINNQLNNGQKIKLYFGLPLPDGNIYEIHPSSIDAILKYTDNCIHFSSLLCEDLAEHAKNLATKFKADFKDQLPKTRNVNFDIAIKKGLMPDRKEFPDWDTMFTKEKP